MKVVFCIPFSANEQSLVKVRGADEIFENKTKKKKKKWWVGDHLMGQLDSIVWLLGVRSALARLVKLPGVDTAHMHTHTHTKGMRGVSNLLSLVAAV